MPRILCPQFLYLRIVFAVKVELQQSRMMRLPLNTSSARRWLALVMLTVSPAASACGDERTADAAPAREVFTPLDRHVAWGRTLTLEENDHVVNVLIRATPDPRGGYLVSDEQENQLRRYDTQGRLLLSVGRRGSGPREFTGLNRAVRLAS